jgi:hypothetical protein
MSVTDRFLAELGPITTGQVPKDADVKYENLVKGLRHINIKVSEFINIDSVMFTNLFHRSGHTKLSKREQSSWSLSPKHSEMPTACG